MAFFGRSGPGLGADGGGTGQLLSALKRKNESLIRTVAAVRGNADSVTTASIEQTTGIGQIGDAVTQLDQVTQQNAALVEESAAAAESLKHQAAQLAQAVAFFTVADAAA